MYMKKQLFTLFVLSLALVSQSGFCQKYTTTDYRPNPFEKKPVQQIETKSELSLMLKKITSPYDEIVFEYSLGTNTFYSTRETYTDFYNAQSGYKTEYIYDSNMNLVKENCFSWQSSGWFNSCYEEFEYDNQGRKTIRTNANNFGNGFVIGGKGYYYYNSLGKLSQYLQKVHKGDGTYNDLNKVDYSYENGKLAQTIDSYFDGVSWVESYRIEYFYDPITGLRTHTNQYNYNLETNSWAYDTKYEWLRYEDKKVRQRNYYRASSSSSWASQSSDRYDFRYDTNYAPYSVYPIYPTVTDRHDDWEEWFVREVDGNSNVIVQEDWSTEDNQTSILSYVYTANYTYDLISIGLNDIDLSKFNISFYPNPTKDILYIDSQDDVSFLQINLYNVLGKRVITQSLSSKQINISSLPKGVYMLNVVEDGIVVKREKIVKQ